MQAVGLSESTPRTESRWRALLWPTIRNEGDFDYVTTQGLWTCFVVAAVTIVVTAIAGSPLLGTFEGTFFFFAGLGVRQRSRLAAIAAFAAYFLSALVIQRYAGNGFGTLRVIFLALLFANIRGNLLSARWARDRQSPIIATRLNETLGDKLADQLPAWLSPKIRVVFYVIATFEISLLLLALVARRP